MMARTALPFLLAALLVAGPARADQALTLASGRSVTLLAATPTPLPDGRTALTFRYRDEGGRADPRSLRLDADELWNRLGLQVARGFYAEGLLVVEGVAAPAEGMPEPGPGRFVYVNDAGGWHGAEFASLLGRLDAERVRDVLARVDWAYGHGLVNSLALYLGEDWVETETDATSQPPRATRLTAGTVGAALTQRLARLKDLARSRQVGRIAIGYDGQTAQAVSTVTESATQDGEPYARRWTVRDELAVRQNYIVLTRTTAEAAAPAPPDQVASPKG